MSIDHPRKAPLGVMPLWLWREANPTPDLADLVQRYHDVAAAVDRCRAAGWPPHPDWLRELGLAAEDGGAG